MNQPMFVRTLELIVLLSLLFWQARPVAGGKGMGKGPLDNGNKKTFARRAKLTLLGAKERDLTSRKIRIYGKSFVIAYNRLVKQSSSKKGSKDEASRVTKVKFIPDSISPSDFSGSEITLSFNVTFTCKLCDSDSTLFRDDAPTRKLNSDKEWDSGNDVDSLDLYLNPEMDDGKIRSRRLSAGPFSAEDFTVTYNQVLKNFGRGRNSLIPASKWSDRDLPVVCTDGDTLEAPILIQLNLFQQDTIMPVQLVNLSWGVVVSYNALNVPNASVCDPFFHRAIGAVAEVLDTNADIAPTNRRNLATKLNVKVNISYQCKGCKGKNTLLKNDAARRLGQLKPSSHLVGGTSQQRTLATSASDCTCPVSSVADVPTYAELAAELDDYVARIITDLDAEVDGLNGVIVESCPGTLITRENFLSFNTNGCSASNDLIAQAIKTSMNDLLSKFCDAEYRTVASVVFDSVIRDLLLFSVTYTCRDCDAATILLDPGISANVLASNLETQGDGNVRRLPEFNNVCYCDVGADNSRRPTVDEVCVQNCVVCQKFLITHRLPIV
jgi:hypothetical protein